MDFVPSQELQRFVRGMSILVDEAWGRCIHGLT
jgi:hypothetical protein